MVYNIFSDGIDARSIGRHQLGPIIRAPQQFHLGNESLLIRILIAFVKFILFIYDLLSLPVYFIIQRPDKRAWDAQRTRSERVDINTWIKTDLNSNEASYLLPEFGSQRSPKISSERRKYRYMGSTISEIFANAVKEFSDRPCLGYRAVVTCPVMTLDEEGKHVMRDKSFRSDYTWYTYEQIGRRVQDIASGLYHYSIQPGTRALFLAGTCLEWFIASQACFQLAAQLVVAPEINEEAPLNRILDEAEIEIVFVSCDRLHQLSELFNAMNVSNQESTKVRQIVIIDWQFSVDFSEPDFAELHKSSKGFVSSIISMGQLEEAGVEHPIQFRCSRSLVSSVSGDGFGGEGGGIVDDYASGLNVTHVDKSLLEEFNLTNRKGELRASFICALGGDGALALISIARSLN